MAKYRYWYLDSTEDPDFDPTVEASSAEDAAEFACEELFNGGDGDFAKSNKIEVAVRLVEGGPAQMFEVFVDWSPSFAVYGRGNMPEAQ